MCLNHVEDLLFPAAMVSGVLEGAPNSYAMAVHDKVPRMFGERRCIGSQALIIRLQHGGHIEGPHLIANAAGSHFTLQSAEDSRRAHVDF